MTYADAHAFRQDLARRFQRRAARANTARDLAGYVYWQRLAHEVNRIDARELRRRPAP